MPLQGALLETRRIIFTRNKKDQLYFLGLFHYMDYIHVRAMIQPPLLRHCQPGLWISRNICCPLSDMVQCQQGHIVSSFISLLIFCYEYYDEMRVHCSIFQYIHILYFLNFWQKPKQHYYLQARKLNRQINLVNIVPLLFYLNINFHINDIIKHLMRTNIQQFQLIPAFSLILPS